MLSVSSTTINQNPSKIILAVRFATSTGITSGFNVTANGSTTNHFKFSQSYGNFSGEAFDNDGPDECGAIRWDNSTCLFVDQAHYRLRNDDGGEAVPPNEWLDTSFSRRKKVYVRNLSGSSFTNVQVKLNVAYDSDMQPDFDDLRFTDSSGTSSIKYWIESFATSTSADVWVKVPSLPASATTTIYMYYGNTATSTTGSSTQVFLFVDDFEDGNISEYSGDTSLFAPSTAIKKHGNYGLAAASGQEDQRTTDGIFRTDISAAQNQTLRFFQFINTSSGPDDEPCVLFAVQSPGTNNNNYAVCLDLFPSDKVVIAKDVSSNDGSGITLASKNVTYSTGWYEVEIDWQTSGKIDVTVYDSAGSVFATTTATDTSYSSGGIGFGFWFQHGGWDSYTSRKFISPRPETSFGIEENNNGATWMAPEDTPFTLPNTNSNVRARFLIQNTGDDIFGQQFRLQIADLGGAANCESVPSQNFTDVPNQSSCGSSPACMNTSPYFANQDPTTNLLSLPSNTTFTPGRMTEDPSNQSASSSILRNQATEMEYNFKFTANATATAYCLRATNAGTPLDNYSKIARINLTHAPEVSNVTLNGGENIALIESTTTLVYATATATDLDGFADLSYATATIYRLGVGDKCTPNENNCYQIPQSQCSFSGCSGTTCQVSCSAKIQYFADPTDIGTFASEAWRASLTVVDSSAKSGQGTSSPVELLTLLAIDVTPLVDYGTLNVGEDTGSKNSTTTVINTGNASLDVNVSGTDLTTSGSSIAVNNQKYATSTFTYSSCSFCSLLSSTTSLLPLNLPKPNSSSTSVSDNVFWGIFVPIGTAGLTHQGQITFTAVAD